MNKYKLEGDAFEAAKHLCANQEALQRAINAIREEAQARITYLGVNAISEMKRLWARILGPYDLDAEAAWNGSDTQIDAQYLELGLILLKTEQEPVKGPQADETFSAAVVAAGIDPPLGVPTQ